LRAEKGLRGGHKCVGPDYLTMRGKEKEKKTKKAKTTYKGKSKYN
jgi:hypothetical protein